MSALRKQMEADMAVRGMAYRTREAYVGSVAELAEYYGRRPDRISEAEVQRYLLHLLEERKLARSSCNIVWSAWSSLPGDVEAPGSEFACRAPKPAKLPQILSREEVARLIEKTTNLKHRALLMTTYGGGLRLHEVCHLKVATSTASACACASSRARSQGSLGPVVGTAARGVARLLAGLPPEGWLFPGGRAGRAHHPHHRPPQLPRGQASGRHHQGGRHA